MINSMPIGRSLLIFVFSFFLLQAPASNAYALEKVDSVAVIKLIGSNVGKITIVNFWASWCPPCREEMPDLVKTRAAYPEDTLVILGISVDEDMDAADSVVKEFGINYPVYIAKSDVYETFGISSIPRLLVYDTEGKLVVDHVGAVTYEDLKKLVDELLEGK